MKTIAISAPTGMLGSMLYKVLKDKYNIVLIYRDDNKLDFLDKAYGNIREHKKVRFDFMSLYSDYLEGFRIDGPRTKEFVSAIGNVDVFINCAGIIKQHAKKSPIDTLFVNGVVPNILSSLFKEKLIHITTDCAFNGIEGAPYDENSIKNPNDLYGLSKSIGEPSQKSLVLRTSIIGPEIVGFVSLLEWFKQQKGKRVQGYTNHLWNGVTTKEFGHICDRIISRRANFPERGLYHIFSTDISKYEMLKGFRNKYNIDVAIEPTEISPIDRRLRTIFPLCETLSIPSFDNMLQEL